MRLACAGAVRGCGDENAWPGSDVDKILQGSRV